MILYLSNADDRMLSNLLIAETLVVLVLSVCYSKRFTSHVLNTGEDPIQSLLHFGWEATLG